MPGAGQARAATCWCSATRMPAIVDGLVLSGGLASFVAPEYDARARAWRTGSRPRRCAEALERVSADQRRVHRLADLLRDGGRRPRPAPRSCTPPGRRAGGRLRLGLALRISPRAARLPAGIWAPTPMLASTHKIVGSLTQSAMLHVARQRAASTLHEVARCIRLRAHHQPQLAVAGLAGFSARRQLAAHGEALLDRTIETASARARAEINGDPRGARSSASRMVGRPGDRGLGSAADRHRRPRDRLHRLPELAAELRARQ